MRIIWRDFHIKRWLIILFLVAFFIYGMVVVRPISDNILTRTMILPIIPLLLLVFILRIRFTYVSDNGIRIGNARNGEYDYIKISKPIFIKWNEIKNIKIYKKPIKQPLMLDYQSFLMIRTFSQDKYESFIAQPDGFIQALKKLKKGYLLAKDSKHLN